jgi:hypothetical protein
VYADALQSEGDPLGEFIALQLQLEGKDDDGFRERADELQLRHGFEWTAPLRAKGVAWWQGLTRPSELRFRRGFVERFDLSPRSRELFEAVCAATPISRVAMREIAPGDLDWLEAHPQLPRLEALTLSGDERADRIVSFLDSPKCDNLRALGLEWSFGGSVLARLRGARPLEGLTLSTVTDSSGDRMYDVTGILAGLDSPHVAKLTQLRLIGHIDLGVAVTLATAPFAPSLKTLTLQDCTVDRLDGRAFPSLERLELGGQLVRAQTLRAFHGSPIRSLEIPRSRLDPALLDTLEGLDLSRLKRLSLWWFETSPAWWRALGKCLGGVTQLDARNGQVTIAAARQLPALTRLAAETIDADAVRLILGGGQMRDLLAWTSGQDAIRAFLDGPNERLRSVNWSEVDPESAIALAQSPKARSLRDVCINRSPKLDDRVARVLADSEHLGDLGRLFIVESAITERGKAWLTERFGSRAVVVTVTVPSPYGRGSG